MGYSNFLRGIHLRSITIGIVVSRQLYAFCHNIAEIITAMNSPKSAFFIYSCYHYSDKYSVRIMIALHADIVLSYEKHLSCGMSSLKIIVSFCYWEKEANNEVFSRY